MAERDRDAPLPDWLPRLAHDLRNPITPMRSAVQLLQLGQLPPELGPDLLRTLDRQIDFLLRMIDDVSDLVKIENGTFALQPGGCDLRELVSAAVARHARRGTNGGKPPVRIEVDAPPAAVVVRADELRLRQLLETLLACLAEDAAGTPATVRIATDGGHGVVRFSGVDGGHGAAACLDYLARGGTPADPASVGMAYLVARRILELHSATLARVDGDADLELRVPLAAPP